MAAGYRLLDTAAYSNEEAVGRAIKSSGSSPPSRGPGRAQDNTNHAFETSRNKLGLDYRDLYLMHQPLGDAYSR
nr:aldo/keto reductase [Streptomyces tropicalis]